MKEMKRFLALLLAVVMIVGMLPANVFAEETETVLDAAIFCSDVHGSTSDLTSVMSGVKTSNITYSSIGFVGDTCLTVANTESAVNSGLGYTPTVMFSYAASHDTENNADIKNSWNYSGEVEGVSDYYLVYTICETDVQYYNDSSKGSALNASAAFTEWYNGLSDAEKALPIFVMSHRPLHARRGGNQGGEVWTQAFNAAGATSDIVVFWAHNHTGETETDTGYYYVERGGKLNVATSSCSSSTANETGKGVDYDIAFTYMNAGYINANNQDPARIGVATTVKITAKNLIFQDYSSSGEWNDENYSHNVPVTRQFAAKTVTPEELSVTGATEYYVGDALQAPTAITVTYSDGTSKTLSASDLTLTIKNAEDNKVTLTGNKFETAGTYSLVYTYTEGDYSATATMPITVTEVQINSIKITTQPTKVSYITGEELDTTGMVVSAVYNNGTTAEITGWYTSAVDMTTAGEKEVTVNYAVDNITYQTTFTITVEEGVAEGVTLEKIEITTPPTKTEYLLSEELKLDGMVVVATFSDGSTVELAYEPFSTSTVYGGYELDNFSMYVEKDHEMVVTYTFGEVTCTATTTINVWNEDFSDENTGVKVHVAAGDYGVTTLKVSPSGNSHVASALADVMKGGTLVAYDITLALDSDATEEGEAVYTLTEGEKTVTLPIPSGVTNPVVYYVSDDGEIENMNATNNGDGTVTFTTTHFSTYVIGESTEIEVPENVTASGSDTATVKKEKTVYVLVSTPTAGNQYIIVSSGSAGTGYALKENTTTGTSVTINAASGSITAPYIETSDKTIMWNATSGLNFQSENGGYYLNYSNSSSGGQGGSNNNSYSLTFSTSTASDWTAGTNQLYRNGNQRDYWLRSNGSTWAMGGANTTYNVYFYEAQTIEVETTTTVSGTYSIESKDITTPVIEGTTAGLSSTLTFTPDSGTATTTDVSTTATYEIVTVDANGNTVDGDPNDIISKIENGVITFTGKYGKALVKVSYTTDFGIVTDYITVTATAPTFDMAITNSVTQLKIGTNLTLTAVPTMDGTAMVGQTITWTSSDTSIATVDASTGAVTGVAAGTANITATWTDPNGTEHTDTVSIEVVDAVYALDLVAPAYAEATVTADTFANGNYYEVVTVYDKISTVTDENFGDNTYYTLNEDGTYTVATEFSDEATYYVQGEAYKIATEYEADTTYYTQSTYVQTTVTEDKFTAGTYYVINDDGAYEVATAYDANATYYIPNSITAPIVLKNVDEGDGYNNIWAAVYADGEDLGKLNDAQLEKLTYVSSNTNIATVDKTTGHVTFVGGTGTVIITCMYEYAEGKYVTDSVIISVSDDGDYRPDDGTDDFQDYPNEGSVRFDKTATAVGNFSKTGITQVELSMTGVPYTVGNEIDVVLMLDTTGSMSDSALVAMLTAAGAFVDKIVINEDGSYNGNHIAVYFFNSGGITTVHDLESFVDENGKLIDSTSGDDYASDYALVKHTLDPETYVSGNSYNFSAIQTSGGTPFDTAAEYCKKVLADHDEDGDNYCGNSQYCVFMSDGGPTTYKGSDGYTYYGGNGSGNRAITSYIGGYTSATSSDWTYNLPTEYYTDAMKATDVTVYTVGLLLQNVPQNPSPYSSMTESTYDSGTDTLTTIGSHYYFTSTILKNMATDESKYYDIFSVANVNKAVAAFETIAQSILEAAKDVVVTDKISDDFTMVFEAPNTTVADELPAGQEFYIEVMNYTLKAADPDGDGDVDENDDGVIDDYVRDTATSLMKLYLGSNGNNYYAASDANGTAYASPTFNQTAIGSMFYWTTTDISGSDNYSGVSVTVNETTYYFDPDGQSNTSSNWDDVAEVWYNMNSGAYASGVKTTKYGKVESPVAENIGSYYTKNADGSYTKAVSFVEDTDYYVASTTSKDLIIATPYFVYNAETRMLVWTAEKLSSTELALSYFLYLDESGGWSGAEGEAEAKTYETNDYAYLNYTNFNNNPCEQVFPVPQITWNGAQVSYVFYLVNENGDPVNRAGRVIPFSEAVYVTDVFTYSIIWNDLEQAAGLEAQRLAANLVPDVYALYDEGAVYKIHVYEDENAVNLNNHFVIESGRTTYTTYVFNTKHDENKYTVPGTYVAWDDDETSGESGLSYLCKSYSVTATVTNGVITSAEYTEVTGETPKKFDTKPSGADYWDENTGYAYYIDENNDVYTIVEKSDGKEVHTGFDFSNTTVAFAVTWKPELVEDTVVVDFGLDVVIDVTTNDAMASGVVGVRADAPSGVVINSGSYASAKAVTTDVMIGDLKIGTASVESLNAVRFSFDKTNGMQFSEPVTFYYESDVNYYANDSTDLTSTSMYSSVTVIPATTVYYEDEYVTLTTSTKNDDGTYTTSTGWTTNSTAANDTQDADRPGVDKVGTINGVDYDADNLYGYDSAYENMSQYSLGSAAKVHVEAGTYATAEFTFYGTGFDVISMTSNTTGTITVKIEGPTSKNLIVDTYYGYVQNAEGEWVQSNNNPNAVYQVPVIKAEGLEYGKYTVTVTATYMSFFDHTTEAGYDFYLDAIRIYDPTGVVSGTTNDTTVSNAYVADGEGWPVYEELRNNVIAAGNFGYENGAYTTYVEVDIEAFEDGVTYYTKNEDGSFTEVTGEYSSETDYYIVDTLYGVVFIDCNDATSQIADYVNYGPNNELYLAAGQAVAFNVSVNDYVADVQLGIKVGNGNSVTYEINGDSYTVNTATDLYYSILKYAKAGTVTIKNVSGGILSLTNIKVTYTSNPNSVSATSLLWMDGESAGIALMSLRAAPAYTEPEIEETEPETNEPEVEETEPETTEPEVEVTEPETTEPEVEETEPETTEPEVEETEPETTEPEVEETEPETTEPEVEETEPEITEPEQEETNSVVDTVVNFVKNLANKFKNWLGKWFN